MVKLSLKSAYRESGLASVYDTGKDAWIVIFARTCRMFAYGASALVLALFFNELKVSDERIGLFMTLTLVGDVGLSLLLTLIADHVGRRRTLLFGSVLMIMSGTTFALCENYWLLLIAAVAGVISATGGDFGPFRAVEESMLSELTGPATRSDVLAWYVTTSTLGSSIGTEIAGHVVQYLHDGESGWSLLQAYHTCYWAYAGMGIVNLVLSLLLSSKCELHRPDDNDSADSFALTSTARPGLHTVGSDSDESSSEEDLSSVGSKARRSLSAEQPNGSVDNRDDDDESDDGSVTATQPPAKKSRLAQISKQTRNIMYGMWFLLMVDSLADGMANIALTSYYLDHKFHMGKDSLGNILSISYFLAACSSVFAGPLSRYIGLINTMVFTHVPSSAAVLIFPLPSSMVLTYILLIIRIGLNNLDQAPRSALIAAIVRPEERTAVLGITSMLRTLASTTGPSLTGLLAGHDRFWIAFVVAGALRLAYDFGIFAMFVNIRLYQYEPVPSSNAHDDEPDTRNTDNSRVLGHPDNFVLDEEESIE